MARTQQTTPAKNNFIRTNKPILIVLFLLVIIASGLIGARIQSDRGGVIVSGSLAKEKKIVTRQSQLISEIAKKVGPSVVSVNVEISSTDSSANNPYQIYGFGNQQQTQAAAGTGIIISSNGLIVTNRHVVPAGTTKVSVTLSDGTELKNVSVVGRTNDSDSLDIAFLKIDDAQGHKLTPAVLGNSADVQVGDDAVAIGNALGQFQNTVTSGIISGYGRSVQASDGSGQSSAENLDNLFQTDAAINEGNSGGPLVNLNAQVIGINTATAGNAQNIGFAIPINDVKGLIDRVVKNGKLTRPYLGIRYLPLSSDVANSYSLDVTNGAFIVPSNGQGSSIASDSPADKAGLQEKDVIIEVNGKKIDQSHSLTSYLNQYQPGDTVTLKVIRNGKTIDVKVKLGELPATNQ